MGRMRRPTPESHHNEPEEPTMVVAQHPVAKRPRSPALALCSSAGLPLSTRTLAYLRRGYVTYRQRTRQTPSHSMQQQPCPMARRKHPLQGGDRQGIMPMRSATPYMLFYSGRSALCPALGLVGQVALLGHPRKLDPRLPGRRMPENTDHSACKIPQNLAKLFCQYLA